jgi:hypothetical protein
MAEDGTVRDHQSRGSTAFRQGQVSAAGGAYAPVGRIQPDGPQLRRPQSEAGAVADVEDRRGVGQIWLEWHTHDHGQPDRL